MAIIISRLSEELLRLFRQHDESYLRRRSEPRGLCRYHKSSLERLVRSVCGWLSGSPALVEPRGGLRIWSSVLNSCTLMVPVAQIDDITLLLQRVAQGDQGAEEELAPRVYRELHRLAAQCLRSERAGHTMQTTELVNEAYMRLAGSRSFDPQGRQQFFGLAAQIMRRILTDYARRKKASKRGGGAVHVSLDEDLAISEEKCELVEKLEPALKQLEEIDSRAARVVELRFFGGLTEEETAQLMGISSRTVKRLWQFSRAWLLSEISSS